MTMTTTTVTEYSRAPVCRLHMVKLLLWLLLFFLCWPLALLALVLYPLLWLLLLPFRLLGVAVDGVLELVKGVLLFPVRLLGGRPQQRLLR
jgi:hypothetical protein